MPIKGYYERSKHAGEAEWEGNTADGRVNGPAKTMRKVFKADAILFSPAVRALILGAFRTHLGLHHSAPIPARLPHTVTSVDTLVYVLLRAMQGMSTLNACHNSTELCWQCTPGTPGTVRKGKAMVSPPLRPEALSKGAHAPEVAAMFELTLSGPRLRQGIMGPGLGLGSIGLRQGSMGLKAEAYSHNPHNTHCPSPFPVTQASQFAISARAPHSHRLLPPQV